MNAGKACLKVSQMQLSSYNLNPSPKGGEASQNIMTSKFTPTMQLISFYEGKSGHCNSSAWQAYQGADRGENTAAKDFW